MDITPILKLMAQKKASDVFFSAGTTAQIKIEGVVYPINQQVLNGDQIKRIAYRLMDAERISRFEHDWEMNFGYYLEEVGNFRVNVFKQRGDVAIVIRYIKEKASSIEELSLPAVLSELVMGKLGLVLVVGSTGSGKSTTLSAMLEHRNESASGHILTVEDPIEYVFHHKKSIVNQREVGIDTHSYHDALKNAMREAPNVLMLGEIRDKDTMQHALTYAQAGHLILSTLHANNSYHVLNRIINFFPHEARASLLLDLSVSLKAVISQRLVKGVDGKLVPAVEVLLNSPRTAELIRTGQIDLIKEAMENSVTEGSQTFEQSLFRLFKEGKITLEEALSNADSPTNLSWKINNDEHAHTRLEEKQLIEEAERSMKKQKEEEESISFDFELNG
ncbi:PilT/PilU family type 4a pilus ATPase [Leeia sp. TBRC 13508]|uniref:PilT/PilU family type 4a pilus ATPase n=1 Tax=Leeia speluncae TaxID=2884804 RepID=A0ABS8DCJ5_9NEIS|nr:PilT/PilU family type 4a pilus ATPase [Leeia speluncae]MCB6185358.1 PilT/PilU family type 4a pilus ATPase [Leeia speluncae]